MGVEFQTPLASNANTLGLGATTKYTDQPTITYSLLIGDKFSKSLMTPIPPAALLGLCRFCRCCRSRERTEASYPRT